MLFKLLRKVRNVLKKFCILIYRIYSYKYRKLTFKSKKFQVTRRNIIIRGGNLEQIETYTKGGFKLLAKNFWNMCCLLWNFIKSESGEQMFLTWMVPRFTLTCGSNIINYYTNPLFFKKKYWVYVICRNKQLRMTNTFINFFKTWNKYF